MRSFRRNHSQSLRSGVAAAEFAVCFPVVVLIVLATIEACTMVFLKQSLTVAAYEGARTAISLNATTAQAEQSAQQILTERRVRGGTVSMTPSNLAGVNAGEYIEVEVSAPATLNSVVPITFYRGRNLKASATMMREF
ncbi:TadE/TadG family type IV pilus assembly protein [Bythopirellula polymerisocia]|uniref:TadE-like protein n=1 Tax=Bythopirellula polymerisocia TaxID=2528003 RepID=A0A5C6D226_9BACT|nr:TadE family protein [Bythopirellula polymerisocia]TWU29894.1 TadE-like protein [Bythopirellula polymerisocia]